MAVADHSLAWLGPVATDMYGGTAPEFQGVMANFLRHTPLAAVRPQHDREEFVKDADKAGGRPVRQTSYEVVQQC